MAWDRGDLYHDGIFEGRFLQPHGLLSCELLAISAAGKSYLYSCTQTTITTQMTPRRPCHYSSRPTPSLWWHSQIRISTPQSNAQMLKYCLIMKSEGSRNRYQSDWMYKLSCRQVSFCHVNETPSHHQWTLKTCCFSHDGVLSKHQKEAYWPDNLSSRFHWSQFWPKSVFIWQWHSAFNLLAFHIRQLDGSFSFVVALSSSICPDLNNQLEEGSNSCSLPGCSSGLQDEAGICIKWKHFFKQQFKKKVCLCNKNLSKLYFFLSLDCPIIFYSLLAKIDKASTCHTERRKTKRSRYRKSWVTRAV